MRGLIYVVAHSSPLLQLGVDVVYQWPEVRRRLEGRYELIPTDLTPVGATLHARTPYKHMRMVCRKLRRQRAACHELLGIR